MVAVMLAGSMCMADSRGFRRVDRDRHDVGRTFRAHHDRDRDHGSYRNPRGDVVVGLIGLGITAAIVSAMDRPAVCVRPAPVPCRRPVVVQPREVVYVRQQSYFVQQPVQVEPPQQVSVTISIQNSNGSYTPVILRQVGSQWVGPRGEYYDAIPSVGQLRPVYGF